MIYAKHPGHTGLKRAGLKRLGLKRTRWKRGGLSVALLVLLVAALNSPLATKPAMAALLGANQFAAVADDASAALTNPAGLMWLGHRAVLLRVSMPGSSGPGLGNPTERLITYAEPDMGLGAGALTLYATPDATQFLYSAARMVGPATAAGASVKYRSTRAGGWWALDIGLRHDLGQEVIVGLAVRNAISSMAKGSGGSAPAPLPVGVQTGISLGNSEGFYLAADYLIEDVNAAAGSSVYNLVARVDLGALSLWGGQRALIPAWERDYVAGMEYRFGPLQLDLAVFDIAGANRAFSLGIAYLF